MIKKPEVYQKNRINIYLKPCKVSYIVIETHGGAEYATIVTNQDGNNLVFENHEDAATEAVNCQDGLVIEL